MPESDRFSRWNPTVIKLTVQEFIKAFSDSGDTTRDFWQQIVERLCDWFQMFGALIERIGLKDQAEVTFRYRPRHSAVDRLAWMEEGNGKDPTPGGLPDVLEWETLDKLLNQHPFEVIEGRVPQTVRNWGVRNYVLVPFRFEREVNRLGFLANAPADALFDAQAMGLWETIQRIAGGMAEHHFRQALVGITDPRQVARSPIGRIFRSRILLEHRKHLDGQYPLDDVGKFLRVVVEECPRDDLPEVLREVLPDLLQCEDWENARSVLHSSQGWPDRARANLARAYLALDKLDVAEAILSLTTGGAHV